MLCLWEDNLETMLDNFTPGQAMIALTTVIIVAVVVANGLSLWLFKGLMDLEEPKPPTEEQPTAKDDNYGW